MKYLRGRDEDRRRAYQEYSLSDSLAERAVVPKPTADKSKRVNSLSIHENWGMNGKKCRD
jgi:hypothetical protein